MSGRANARRLAVAAWRDVRGAAALETALVLLPFLVLLFATLQVAMAFVSQSALDTGVLRTAEQLRANMVPGVPYVPPSATSLAASVAANGSVILAGGTLVVDLQPITALSGAAVPIANGTVNAGMTSSVLILRAKIPVISFSLGLPAMVVTSSAILRRPAS